MSQSEVLKQFKEASEALKQFQEALEAVSTPSLEYMEWLNDR